MEWRNDAEDRGVFYDSRVISERLDSNSDSGTVKNFV